MREQGWAMIGYQQSVVRDWSWGLDSRELVAGCQGFGISDQGGGDKLLERESRVTASFPIPIVHRFRF